MKWNNIKITLHKEIRGIVRDTKSLHKLLLYPFLVPLIIFLFGLLFEFMENSTYIVGTNYELTAEEKAITKNIENIKFKVYKDKKELDEKYNNKEINGYILKNENEYTIYSDPTVASGEMISSYASSYLESYNYALANNYLISKGIDSNKVFNNITIDTKSLAKEESNSLFTIILSLSISYILMIVVMSCVVVATDATSGEKERGTLETILTFPVKSEELVAGKYLATAIIGCISGLLAYALTIPAILIGKEIFTAFEDITVNINIVSTLLVLGVIVISAILSAGVCIALSGKAKTYKEAQSSQQLIPLLPMIPYFVKIMEVDTSVFNFVPIANCGMALNDITMNNINYNSLLIIFVTTIIYIVLIILYISKQYKKEETLFS